MRSNAWPHAASTDPLAAEAAPEKRASALLDLLPGNSLISKTSWVTLGTGISALAISKELYVANEETVVLAGFLIFATLVGKQLAAPYAEWADGQIKVSVRCGWKQGRTGVECKHARAAVDSLLGVAPC